MPAAPTHLEVELAQMLATNMTADAVVVASYGGAGAGIAVFAGPEQEPADDGFAPTAPAIALPHLSIWVLQTDGLDVDVTLDRQLFEKPVFDVMVRSDLVSTSGDTAYIAARDAAEAAAKAVNRRVPSGWLNCFVLGTRARYEGKDETNHHRFLLRVVGEKQGTLG